MPEEGNLGEKRAKDGQAETPHRPTNGQPRWQEAIDLLASGQYKDAATLLEETEAAADANGDPDLTIVLQAAREICLAGNDFRAEVDHHEQAYQAATQREQQLRQHLQALLNIIAARMGLPGREVNISPSSSSAPGPPQDSEIPGLLQRLQSLLGRSPDGKSIERDGAAPQAEAPVPAPAEPELTVIHNFAAHTGSNNSGPDLASRPDSPPMGSDDRPSLTVYCLGPFQLYQDDEPIEEWPSGKGKSVLKYLVMHRRQPVAKEVLMDLFWPDSDPDAARNSLNVAIYGLRQALRKGRPHFHHVLFEDDRYLLNRDLHIWLDVEEFRQRLSAAQKLQQRGNMEAAIRLYGACEALYRGEFLAEDRYEEWAIPNRRSLQDDYLGLLEQLSRYYLQQEAYATCITVCEKMLAVEPCREDAHRQLMRAYSRQAQRYLALRQYHACREALERELGVEPGRRTAELYDKIRCREPI